MNLRFIQNNLYALFAALALIAATICWFGTSLPKQSSAAPAPAEPWRLPQRADHNSQKSITAINARNLWGNLLAAGSAPKAPEWHIVGITTAGAERFVLLAYEGKPVATLKVGDALPDDTKIVQIETDRFFVRTQDNKKLAFGLYKHDQAK